MNKVYPIGNLGENDDSDLTLCRPHVREKHIKEPRESETRAETPSIVLST